MALGGTYLIGIGFYEVADKQHLVWDQYLDTLSLIRQYQSSSSGMLPLLLLVTLD
jgi:hypothetical protein